MSREMWAVELTAEEKAERERARIKLAQDQLDGRAPIDPGEGQSACHQRELERIARLIEDAVFNRSLEPGEVQDLCANIVRRSPPT